jgi:CcmD family protein
MIYLFAAFFALWALTFGYVYSIHTRQQRLEQELGVTQETADR